MTANFSRSSSPKTFYFYADRGGDINRSSVTYRLGDTPVTVTGAPESGYQFKYWTVLSGGDIRLYDDRSASLVVNDEF